MFFFFFFIFFVLFFSNFCLCFYEVLISLFCLGLLKYVERKTFMKKSNRTSTLFNLNYLDSYTGEQKERIVYF